MASVGKKNMRSIDKKGVKCENFTPFSAEIQRYFDLTKATALLSAKRLNRRSDCRMNKKKDH